MSLMFTSRYGKIKSLCLSLQSVYEKECNFNIQGHLVRSQASSLRKFTLNQKWPQNNWFDMEKWVSSMLNSIFEILETLNQQPSLTKVIYWNLNKLNLIFKTKKSSKSAVKSDKVCFEKITEVNSTAKSIDETPEFVKSVT